MKHILARFDPNDPPSGGSIPPAPTGGGKTDGTDKGGVTITREEYDALQAAKSKATTLEQQVSSTEQDWTHVRRLMRGNGTPEEIANSVRYVMKKEGYSESEIETYIQENARPAPASRPKGKKDEEGDPQDEPDPMDLKVKAVDQRLSQIEVERLQGRLSSGIREAVDSNKNLGRLIDGLAATDPDGEGNGEGRAKRLSEVLKDVERETRDRLKSRRAESGGRWDDRWIEEEAGKAVEAVYSRYRTLVGDPARLGRTSEMGVGEDRFTNRQPVKPPQPKKGMKFDQAAKESRDWALDTLLRSADELGRGGKTSV